MARTPKYLDGACPACVARGKTWQGDNPRCAFAHGGEFNPDNWNCATMNRLRTLPVVRAFGDDETCAIVPLPEAMEGDDGSGFIVLSWYKHRGCCEGAVCFIDQRPAPLTLARAQRAITAGEEREKRPLPAVCPRCCSGIIEAGMARAGELCGECKGLALLAGKGEAR